VPPFDEVHSPLPTHSLYWHARAPEHRPLIVDCEDPLLRVLIGSDGRPLISLLSAALTDSGLSLTDPRVVAIYSKIGALSKPDEIDPARFGRIPHEDLLARALQGRLAVKKFSSFARKLDAIIRAQAESLRSSDGKPFGLSVCTVDGQRYDSGSTINPISVDTISEVVTYAIGTSAVVVRTASSFSRA